MANNFIDNLSKEEITPKALEEAVLLESQFQRNVGSGGTYTLKNSGASNEAKFFAGPNPNNWIQFGKDNNHYILMWRIIKANAEGIKIIYEGIRNGNNFPTADGRVTIDGTELIAWHTSNGNKWKTATLKSKLENWYNSLRIEDKLIQQIKWCLGGVGEGTGYSTTPVSISQFIAAECIDGTYGGGAFDGKTESVTGYGLIRASDYLSTTSSALCTGSYYASGNNNRDCGVTGGQSTNFLYKSSYKWWTFTANNTSSTIVWGITNTGVITTPAANDTTYSVRPVLNLKPDILYKGGFGTLTNPYIVE